ncbi:hypothetical protein L2E82_49614 [Cichorium intybus]|uniref:Uncharacterized protein n=1 Tax=Cichorium intybus TaxID=13427 RepID=A0ACB8Z0Z8_CICIN|nr:hypothetical protein L2E82_49614 [Cichorium intybus]
MDLIRSTVLEALTAWSLGESGNPDFLTVVSKSKKASITTPTELLASLEKKFRQVFKRNLSDFKKKKRASTSNGSEHLTSIDYAVLGATSKLAAIVVTYPFQVIRARLQLRLM